MITWQNYEEYMMMHADGELSPAEEAALMSFIAQHPQLQKELDLYSAARLTPDPAQVYAAKDALLKPVTAKRVIALPVWARYSIAAGIAAMLLIPLLLHTSVDRKMQLAVKDTVIHTPVGVATQHTNVAAVASAANMQNNASQPASKAVIANHAHPVKETKFATTGGHKEQRAQSHNIDTPLPGSPTSTAIAQLPVAATTTLPATRDKAVAQPVPEPQYTLATVAEESTVKRSLWDVLPIKESGKQELQNIASTISGTYGQVNEVKHDIENTTLTVRVEKKKLMITF